MKCRWVILFLLLAVVPMAAAQKYACVNTDYVLRNIPEYAEAQKKLDRLVEEWRKELEEKMAEIDRMRTEYEQESFLLPDNLKKQRLEDIRLKEQEIHELQQKRFGADGDLDKKRSELMRSVQDRVYSAIERIAKDKGYAFVFDKAGSATVLFASKKYDISDEVLESLGYKPGMVQTEETDGKQKPQTKKGNAATNPEMRVPLSGSR
ncbi:MAG: OmpH family outer membrane protein [Bacteroidales bacterium]|nr:OmpH family outer membrane protein [Bacteroidales bacterium]